MFTIVCESCLVCQIVVAEIDFLSGAPSMCCQLQRQGRSHESMVSCVCSQTVGHWASCAVCGCFPGSLRQRPNRSGRFAGLHSGRANHQGGCFLRLGEPNALYEDARILTYRLSQDEKGWILLGPTKGWSEAFVNLVLVFDSQGVLRRHSQVKVRSP